MDVAERAMPAVARAKSVQDYIDELPGWLSTRLKSAPMTGMQWRIWSLAAAGKFFEGFVVFMTGVALPLIVREFHSLPAEKASSAPPASPASCSAQCC
jgi:MFS transporter, putative metabolite transport protein